MKLKDIILLKQKTKEELKAMLPALKLELQDFKLKNQSPKVTKYKIALIKTICSK
jgi:ribosomal protein L29